VVPYGSKYCCWLHVLLCAFQITRILSFTDVTDNRRKSGLSATIGSPHQFSDWLAAVQKAHNFEYEFIEHTHRYSHLRKYFYLVDGKGDFTNLEQHVATNRTRFLHPISILSFGTRNLPDDLSLEASDTLLLYNALLSVQHGIDHDLSSLAPSIFFASTPTLLRQRDVFKYEARLKAIVVDLLRLFDPRDPTTPLGHVIRILQDGNIRDLGDQVDNVIPSPAAFKNDLLVLLADLHSTGDLVRDFSLGYSDSYAHSSRQFSLISTAQIVN